MKLGYTILIIFFRSGNSENIKDYVAKEKWYISSDNVPSGLSGDYDTKEKLENEIAEYKQRLEKAAEEKSKALGERFAKEFKDDFMPSGDISLYKNYSKEEIDKMSVANLMGGRVLSPLEPIIDENGQLKDPNSILIPASKIPKPISSSFDFNPKEAAEAIPSSNTGAAIDAYKLINDLNSYYAPRADVNNYYPQSKSVRRMIEDVEDTTNDMLDSIADTADFLANIDEYVREEVWDATGFTWRGRKKTDVDQYVPTVGPLHPSFHHYDYDNYDYDHERSHDHHKSKPDEDLMMGRSYYDTPEKVVRPPAPLKPKNIEDIVAENQIASAVNEMPEEPVSNRIDELVKENASLMQTSIQMAKPYGNELQNLTIEERLEIENKLQTADPTYQDPVLRIYRENEIKLKDGIAAAEEYTQAMETAQAIEAEMKEQTVANELASRTPIKTILENLQQAQEAKWADEMMRDEIESTLISNAETRKKALEDALKKTDPVTVVLDKDRHIMDVDDSEKEESQSGPQLVQSDIDDLFS